MRRSGTFVGYVIAVVGPESVPGCTRDVTLAFRVDGQPAKHDPVANRLPGVALPGLVYLLVSRHATVIVSLAAASALPLLHTAFRLVRGDTLCS